VRLMKIDGLKVAVTGGAGFIGSHLVEALVKRGCLVKALVLYNGTPGIGNLKFLSKDVLSKIEIVQGNILDYDGMLSFTKKIDAVFHLAAQIAIPYSYANPVDTFNTNVMGTLNVLNAARLNECSRIVHTSTSETYGSALYVPMDEKHPLQAQSPYSGSKIGADKVAESFFLSYDMPVATIRPFNAYGPRQSARAVIPTIITQALTSDKVKLGSTHTTRDFTFVKDTAEGFIAVAESDKALGEVVNVGSGFEISIADLVKKIVSVVGRDVEVVSDSERVRPEKSEVQRLFCANQKAKELCGWQPKYTLEEGLK
jgi:NAD dependent epimerase/dehydratase